MGIQTEINRGSHKLTAETILKTEFNRTKIKTFYVCKDPQKGQTKCDRDNDPNLIKTVLYWGMDQQNESIWTEIEGIEQQRFTGSDLNHFWGEVYPDLRDRSVVSI